MQLKLREQGPGPQARSRKTAQSPLVGKPFDQVGNGLTPSHATKNGRQYRYYISTALMRGPRDETGGWRLPAPQLEVAVAEGAALCLADRGAIAAVLEQAGIPPSAIAAMLEAADHQRRRLRSESERAEALVALVDRVELKPGMVSLTLRLAPLIPNDATKADAARLTVMRDLPLRIKRRGVETRLVIEDARMSASKADPILLKEVARAHRFGAFLTGSVAAMAELSAREAIDERYVRRLLPLAFLAPEIVQAIITGAQPLDLTAKKLIRRIALPLDWKAQKQVLGFL